MSKQTHQTLPVSPPFAAGAVESVAAPAVPPVPSETGTEPSGMFGSPGTGAARQAAAGGVAGAAEAGGKTGEKPAPSLLVASVATVSVNDGLPSTGRRVTGSAMATMTVRRKFVHSVHRSTSLSDSFN